MKTDQQCKSMLIRAGLKYGVSPTLISTRLLSEENKDDMRNGFVDQEDLNAHVEAWIEAHMPDYRNGSSRPYNRFYDLKKI